MIKSNKEIASFYDQFNSRQRRDFINGNLRVDAAIERVCGSINSSTKSILDIGCGCGQLAWEYARRHPSIQVVGLDISPKNIAVANQLFKLTNLSFDVSDLSEPPERKFDLISLIDVYEHIPRDSWPQFNKNLSRCLSEDGVLVLTTPTPLHQQNLLENKPSELQVVDETVELSDLVQLALDLEATPILFQWMDIWKRYDYTHFVCERSLKEIGPSMRKRKLSILSRLSRKIRCLVRKKQLRKVPS